MENLNQQLDEFFETVVPLATHIPAANYSTDTDLRVALEGFCGGPARSPLCHGAE